MANWNVEVIFKQMKTVGNNYIDPRGTPLTRSILKTDAPHFGEVHRPENTTPSGQIKASSDFCLCEPLVLLWLQGLISVNLLCAILFRRDWLSSRKGRKYGHTAAQSYPSLIAVQEAADVGCRERLAFHGGLVGENHPTVIPKEKAGLKCYPAFQNLFGGPLTTE